MTTLALPYLFELVREDFRTWHAHHEVPASAIDSLGQSKLVKAYLRTADNYYVVTTPTSVVGGVTVQNEPIGIVDQLDDVKGVGVTTVAFSLGWRKPLEQGNYGPGGRIVFQPGDENGAAGKAAAAQKVADLSWPVGSKRNPRSIGTLYEFFTVFVWGRDSGAGLETNELAQYIATRTLYDAVYLSLYNHASAGEDANGYYPLNDPKWIIDHAQRPFGGEIKATGVVQAMHGDHAFKVVKGPPLTGAFTTTLHAPGSTI
jgi:hypothetical protein